MYFDVTERAFRVVGLGPSEVPRAWFRVIGVGVCARRVRFTW